MQLTVRFAARLLILCSVILSSSTFAASVTRGPYLQMASDSAITVRWRTDTSTDSFVRYGSTPTNLNQTASVSGNRTEHEVRVTGLSSLSKYYYSIGSSSQTLAGGDNTYYFTTSPTPGVSTPTRVWLIGDAGTANASQAAVYNAYLNYQGADNTDLWIMLGDNAYNSGTDSEYQNAVFNMYPELLRRSTVWATLGNHDGASADSATESGPYYDIFSLPRNAEAGGLASGTEAYYSFDYGDIHFICLDSYETSRSTNGAMLTWMQNDIAATDKTWIIAFWHHPPYTKGSHNSDSESNLIDMRQNALPILESYGVDLVLSGHSHSYERSFLIDGHYGSSGSFSASHKIDSGSGREDGSGAYQKANGAAHAGAVYTVAGSSGKTSGGTLNHPAMYTSLNQLGSVVLDVNGNRLDAKFLNNSGNVTDYYTLIKGNDTTPPSLNSASSSTNNEVVATFSESIDVATGANAANYNIDGGVSVLSASVSGSQVTLATSVLTEGFSYTLTVNNVEDLDGNVISANSQTNFSYINEQTTSFQNGVSPTGGYNGTQDSWIASGVPSANHGSEATLLADGSDGTNVETVSVVQWDITSIPAGSTVTDVEVELTVFNPSAGAYNIYAGGTNWNEGSVTWNSLDPYNTRGSQVASFVPSSAGKYSIALNAAGIAMVQGWVDGTANQGIYVMTGGTGDGLDMRSSEYGTATERPRLIVTYGAGSGGNVSPSAAFTYVTNNLDVNFTDTSSDSDGSIISWSWDFGDGNSSTAQNPAHSYVTSSTYSVALTVTDDQGAQNTATQNVAVSAAPDTQAPSVPSGLVANNVTTSSVTLVWNASSDNIGVAGYKVRRDGVIVGDVTNTTFSDTGLGSNSTYGYTVQAYDAAGNNSAQSATTIVTTNNVAPIAGFTANATLLSVNFTDTSADSDGNVVSWNWTFGDSASSTAQNPVHVYSAAGTYTVTLTVTDNSGATDDVSANVTVTDNNQPTTVSFQQGLSGYGGAQDTYVASGAASANWGNSSAILADGDDKSNDELISLLKWDISSIPSGATVTSASITVRVFNRTNNVYNLWQLLTSWSEGSATWSNTQPIANRGSLIGSFSPTSTGSYTINLNANGIAMVQSWINSGTNNGLIIQSGGTKDGIDMRSSEYGTQSQRPKLTVTYQ